MITKAYVEEKVDNYKYRVRIPLFDRTNEATYYTQFEDLSVATACVPKGINNSIEVGDVVFLGFEDNDASQPIILGQLYREALVKDPNTFANLLSLKVQQNAQLPVDTTIGNINYNQLHLALDTIQDLKRRIIELESYIELLKEGSNSQT